MGTEGGKDMEKGRCEAHCLCNEMAELFEEQQRLSFEGFRFVCDKIGFDTIPFVLSNGNCAFEVFGRTKSGLFFTTQVFRLESLDTRHCCAKLSLLLPVDIDGFPVDLCDEVFSLLKTNNCIIVDLSCFCSFQPLSPKLVNRELPIVEPKC
jgi:spore coat protein Y